MFCGNQLSQLSEQFPKYGPEDEFDALASVYSVYVALSCLGVGHQLQDMPSDGREVALHPDSAHFH